jgi:hypothetical protein
LAHGDHVRVRPEQSQGVDHVVDVLVKPEATCCDRDVTSVVPVDHVDVVLGEQRADRGPEQCGEVPGHRSDDQ